MQELLPLFIPLLALQPFIVSTKKCSLCDFEDKIKSKWPLPLRIHDIDHLNFDNIQKYFYWFLNSRVELCSWCEEKRSRVQATEIQDPSFIVIDFINKGKTDQRTINIAFGGHFFRSNYIYYQIILCL